MRVVAVAATLLVAGAAAALGWWLATPAPTFALRPVNYDFDGRAWLGETSHPWGAARPVPAREADQTLRPFVPTLTDEQLQRVRDAVAATRSVRPAREDAASAWGYGASARFVGGLVDYWLSTYDWRAHEREMARWTHYTTDIDGLRVHCAVRRADRAHGRPVVPLVLLHGWPSSFWEFHRVIDELAEPTGEAARNKSTPLFDVVVPSLPGFGYSETPARGDVGPYEAAAIVHELVIDRLRYKAYYVHGGDIGAYVAQAVAQLYPDDILGVHLTTNPAGSVLGLGPQAVVQLVLGALHPPYVLPDPVDQAKVYPLGQKLWSLFEESAYAVQAMTRPDTLAWALAQSPVSTLAYVAEKFHAWADVAPDEPEPIGRDDVITTALLFHATRAMPGALRWYHHMLRDPLLREGARCRIPVPVGFLSVRSCTGLSLVESVPRPWAGHKFPRLVTFTELARGGHFVALEAPDALVRDLRAFVAAVQAQRADV